MFFEVSYGRKCCTTIDLRRFQAPANRPIDPPAQALSAKRGYRNRFWNPTGPTKLQALRQ